MAVKGLDVVDTRPTGPVSGIVDHVVDVEMDHEVCVRRVGVWSTLIGGVVAASAGSRRYAPCEFDDAFGALVLDQSCV